MAQGKAQPDTSQKVEICADLGSFGLISEYACVNFFAHILTSLIPRDFLFQLTQAEKAGVVANCDHIQNPRFSKALPFAFTEHGAIRAANVLASSQAVVMGIYVVWAFVQLGQLLDAV